MKVDVIVVYVQRYRKGHELDFVPPLTGIHLAAITPRRHRVRVIHQRVARRSTSAPTPTSSPCLSSAASRLRRSAWPGFSGLAENVWSPAGRTSPIAPRALQACQLGRHRRGGVGLDRAAGRRRTSRLRPRYHGSPCDMKGLPTPRYDLLPPRFLVLAPHHRQRPAAVRSAAPSAPCPRSTPASACGRSTRVLNDVAYDRFPHWWRRKSSWFSNVTINRPAPGAAGGDRSAATLVAHPGQPRHRQGRRAAGPHGGVRLHRHLLRSGDIHRRVAGPCQQEAKPCGVVQ